MAYANTVDERYVGGTVSYPAGRWDAQGILNSATVLAEGDPAFGTLDLFAPSTTGGDIDIYALGTIAAGKYLVEVEDFVWDRLDNELNDVSSFSVLSSTGAVLATSSELSPILLSVPSAGAFYLQINGPFSVSSQYEAAYTRLGPVDHRTDITSSASRTLGADQLNLSLRGGRGIDGTGNDFGNGLSGNRGANTLVGLGGNDTILGGARNDRLEGGTGRDRMDGGTGADVLLGGAGADRLTGGAGADKLIGGADADIFRLLSAAESPNGRRHDVISDFRTDIDKIDLQPVDANSVLGGHQDFTFIGSQRFHDIAGELRFKNGLLAGDVDGDGRADLEIALAGGSSLDRADLLL